MLARVNEGPQNLGISADPSARNSSNWLEPTDESRHSGPVDQIHVPRPQRSESRRLSATPGLCFQLCFPARGCGSLQFFPGR
jgi:hypothetical protein